MKTITNAALTSLKNNHGLAVKTTVLTTFQSGLHPTGTEISVIDGDIILDGTADIWATLDLTTDGTQKWPVAFHGHYDDEHSLLAPYGNELFIERAIKYNNITEWIALGYFRIESAEQSIVPDGPIRIGGLDRMAGIIDARLLVPIQFPSTRTYGQVVNTLVLGVYPNAVIEWDDITKNDTINRTLVVEENRFEFLKNLVTSLGKIWYWDNRGILVIKDVPSSTAPVWDVAAGEGGVLVSVGRKLRREGVFNAVVATGEAGDTKAPVRGIAYDNNPNSATYFFGRFGPVPRFYSSPFITTNAQAQSAATSLLTKNLGFPYNVNFSAVPNPALEPYDPVTVKYPIKSRQRSNQSEVHVIDTITIPLNAANPITTSTREQSLVAIASEE